MSNENQAGSARALLFAGIVIAIVLTVLFWPLIVKAEEREINVTSGLLCDTPTQVESVLEVLKTDVSVLVAVRTVNRVEGPAACLSLISASRKIELVSTVDDMEVWKVQVYALFNPMRGWRPVPPNYIQYAPFEVEEPPGKDA